MYESLRSVLIGTIGLSVAAAAALLLTVVRKPLDHDSEQDTIGRERAVSLLLFGLAAQSLHFMEEFVTRFQDRFPALFGLEPWSANFFVIFNLSWFCVWILAAIGLQKGYRVAFFPVWFFALAAIANGVVHPILAICGSRILSRIDHIPAGWSSRRVAVSEIAGDD